MQIEVVSTRLDEGSIADTTKFDQSLTLAAAGCLAIALKGRIEKISSTSRGFWLSASIPINT